jgi:hypothetical protein
MRSIRRRAALVLFGAAPRLAGAAGAELFATVERLFDARSTGTDAIVAVLGAGPLRVVSPASPAFDYLAADLPPLSPFTSLDLRHHRTRAAGIAVLAARAGNGTTPQEVRARYGSVAWNDVRPELPFFYLRYERRDAYLGFGFPRGAGELARVVVSWGLG